MNKKDLKAGYAVKLKDGRFCLITKDNKLMYLKNGCFICMLEFYNDDLTYGKTTYYKDKHNKSFEIQEVYEDYTLKNLLWKRTNLLTKNEIKELKKLLPFYKYIIRNKKGNLIICKEKPTKSVNGWLYIGDTYPRYINKFLFSFIKWEDKEPYNITKLLSEEGER